MREGKGWGSRNSKSCLRSDTARSDTGRLQRSLIGKGDTKKCNKPREIQCSQGTGPHSVYEAIDTS